MHTVPEHAFALILALRRNLLAYRQDVENGVWNRSEQFCFFTHPIGDLHGSTLGIIGEGAIGRARRPSGAPSACACCSPIMRRRRWTA